MIKKIPIKTLLSMTLFASITLISEEMIIGKEKIMPGIILIFEAAPKDIILPEGSYLSEKETNIHIEMLANWSSDAPKGSPEGGFVPYLKTSVTIKNSSGIKLKVDLTPHLNLTDNLHYAQNIKLPGSINDTYEVIFEISPPENNLGIHFDWNQAIGKYTNTNKFVYRDLNFKNIALATRR